MLYAEVEYEGKKYSIDIPRRGSIKALRISKTPASGGLANALREMGKEPVRRVEIILDDDERAEVILACGWNFSRSWVWRQEWDDLYRQAGGWASRWGKKLARRVT